MSDTPEPYPVVQKVEQYVDDQVRDIGQYDNREPFDESGVYSLHLVAAEIYALGFRDGEAAQAERSRRDRYRDRGES